MENTDRKTKISNDLADFIAWILLIFGVLLIINALTWTLTEDKTGQWINRVFGVILSLGFSGLIFRLRK